jgi:hypothetical protein
LRKNLIRIVLVMSIVLVGLLATTGTVLADKNNESGNFLCPAVGKGVLNHNPGAIVLPNDNYSFFPGNNQAGMHANNNARNTLGPGASPGPGNGNSDWSPIWPGN